MTNKQLEKISVLAKRIRIQALIAQEGNISELSESDIQEFFTMQVQMAKEIEVLSDGGMINAQN